MIRKPNFYGPIEQSSVQSVILAEDFISYVYKSGKVLTFGADLSSLFSKDKLNHENVYKLSVDKNYNASFDSISDKNNKNIKDNVKEESFVNKLESDSGTEILKNYVLGIKNGYCNSPQIKSDINFEKYSDPYLSAYTLGFIISSFIYEKTVNLNKQELKLKFKSKKDWENFSKLISAISVCDSDFKKLSKYIESIHNGMIKVALKNDISCIDSVKNDIENFLIESRKLKGHSNKSLHLKEDLKAVKFFANILQNSDDQVTTNNLKTINTSIFDKVTKNNLEIELSKAQVRLLDQKEDSITLRFQFSNLNIKNIINLNEENKVIENNLGSGEKDLNISYSDISEHYESLDCFKDKFYVLNHSESSTANTSKKYVPLSKGEGGLFAKEDSSLIIPNHVIYNILTKGNQFFKFLIEETK